jgi:hypothetical protein
LSYSLNDLFKVRLSLGPPVHHTDAALIKSSIRKKEKAMKLSQRSLKSLFVCGFVSLVALIGSSSTAFAQAGSSIRFFVRNVDLADSCGNTSSAFRPEFRIVNNSGTPLDLTAFKIKMYFNNAQPIQFVNADFVRLFTGTQAFAGFGTVAPGPDEVLPEDPNCSPPAGGFCGCGASPARKANQARTIQFTSGSIPAMGFADVIVMYWRGGAIPFDVGCDDFSKLLNLNPSRPFFEDAFFSLFQGNQRIIGSPLGGSLPQCSTF